MSLIYSQGLCRGTQVVQTRRTYEMCVHIVLGSKWVFIFHSWLCKHAFGRAQPILPYSNFCKWSQTTDIVNSYAEKWQVIMKADNIFLKYYFNIFKIHSYCMLSEMGIPSKGICVHVRCLGKWMSRFMSLKLNAPLIRQITGQGDWPTSAQSSGLSSLRTDRSLSSNCIKKWGLSDPSADLESSKLKWCMVSLFFFFRSAEFSLKVWSFKKQN